MSNDPLARLWQHAGLPSQFGSAPQNTLHELLVRIANKDQNVSIQSAVQDVVDCIHQANADRRARSASTDKIDVALVYAVNGIVRGCLDDGLAARDNVETHQYFLMLMKAAWRIECAWDALLAGDIEDVREHVAGEESVRDWIAE